MKCFRKTKDYSVLAEIKEKMGKPNDAIRILLKHGKALKALECASNHESDVLPCYKKEHLAHKYVKKIISEGEASTEEFQAYLKYLPPLEQLHYLKSVKLYREVYQILLHEKKYEEAYQLCSAHGWFDEGLALAVENKNADVKTIFLLNKATKELDDDCVKTDTIKMLQKNMGLLTENENLCMLVWGLIKKNHAKLNDVRSFYKNRNVIAYLEVLNIATAHVEYDSDNHQWNNIRLNKQEDLVMTILKACDSAQFIRNTFENSQDMSSPIITNMENFFGFQRDHSGIYLIPESSYPWTNELIRSHIPKDLMERSLEGMLKVKFDTVIKAVCSRLKEFCHRWIVDDSLKIVEVLYRRIKRFSYHEQLVNNGGHLTESCLARLDKSANLQAYLELVGFLHQTKELGNDSIPFDVVELALNALSPQATCYLQVPQLQIPHKSEQLSSLVFSFQLRKCLNDRAKDIWSTADEKFRVGEWLESWRIMNITKYGIREMQNFLIKKSHEMSVMIQTQQIQAFPQYVYNIKENKYNHLMLVWIATCGKMKTKKVYAASTVCVREFILPIASNPALWETVSVSNFLSVATIQLVAILMMTNIISIYSRQPGIMYIPLSYSHIVKVFLLTINCGTSLFDSCYDDTMKSRKEALPVLRNKLIHLMRLIMKALIGKHNFAFNLLERTTSDKECLENHEAEHCLILVLTLLANMSLIESVTPTELHSFQQQICTSIKQCDKPIIKQLYDTLLTSTTVNNYFAIIMNLLQSSRDSLESLNIQFSGSNYKVVCKTEKAKLQDISQRTLISMSQNLPRESKAATITQFKLRPSAPAFRPSWMKPSIVKNEVVAQSASSHNEDTALDDIDVTVGVQDINEEDTTEENTDDFKAIMITGLCRICASVIHSEWQEDDSISAKRTKILNHFKSEEHQMKLKEHERFNSEIEVYVQGKKHLSDLANQCEQQYESYGQYYELKKVIDKINGISREFEKELEKIHGSAEWREGITQMEIIGGKIRSLIMTGERELKISQNMKLKLDLEQDEQEKKEDEEQDEVDSDNWEENIPNADPNSGDSAKKKKRSAKKRRLKMK